jgi:clan AA aspartic protease (TIGR02281 family)
MEKQGGVYTIPCKINGLPLKFIFDTGASDVSISLTEALFMLKNGYLKESDIKGSVYYSIANGDISEGTKINLLKIEVGNQVLYNVEASIVHTTEAPLLFGQSAMERFGKYTMDYSNSNLIINKPKSKTSNISTHIKSIKIGTQTWMIENLNISTFRNGDPIPEAKTDEEWDLAGKTKQPAWCYYNNDPKINKKIGKLYNWYAIVDPRGLAPKGWHIPTEEEWDKLIILSGGDSISGKKLKSSTGWYENGNGTNIYGFTVLPGGDRRIDGFFGMDMYGHFWCSSLTKYKEDRFYPESYKIEFYNNFVNKELNLGNEGLSVRCIKD